MKLIAILSMVLCLFGCSASNVTSSDVNAFSRSIIATSNYANIELADDKKIDCRRLSAYLELGVDADYCAAVAADLGIPQEYVITDTNYKELLKALDLHRQEAEKMQLLAQKEDEGSSIFSGMFDGFSDWLQNIF